MGETFQILGENTFRVSVNLVDVHVWKLVGLSPQQGLFAQEMAMLLVRNVLAVTT